MQQNVTISQAIQLATQYLQNKQFQQSWSICQKILQHEPQNQQVHWISKT
jgi:Tfp pilus assembly protein PilF